MLLHICNILHGLLQMPSLCLCLEQLNICQDVAIVVREFDTEPLILKNRSRRVNPKEWDFCVLASDCSSCFSWHQWVNNSWAAAAASVWKAAAAAVGLSSSSSLESSSWPAAGHGERKGGFQRKEAAQPRRKSLALTTFQTAFRREDTKPANAKGHSIQWLYKTQAGFSLVVAILASWKISSLVNDHHLKDLFSLQKKNLSISRKR